MHLQMHPHEYSAVFKMGISSRGSECNPHFDYKCAGVHGCGFLLPNWQFNRDSAPALFSQKGPLATIRPNECIRYNDSLLKSRSV